MCSNDPVWGLWEEFVRTDSGVQRKIGVLLPEKGCVIGAIQKPNKKKKKKTNKYSYISKFQSVSYMGREERKVMQTNCLSFLLRNLSEFYVYEQEAAPKMCFPN